jgi:hypothetical protein
MASSSEKIRFWIDMALECVRRDHTDIHVPAPGDQRGPFLTARTLGLALGALNDAHAHASGTARLLNVPATPGLSGATAEIAGAAACAEVLQKRYPHQAVYLNQAWRDWLEYFGLGAAGSAAENAGRAFGDAVRALGTNDIANAAIDQYTATGAPYTHIAPPHEPNQHYAGGIWGNSTPLLAPRITNFP